MTLLIEKSVPCQFDTASEPMGIFPIGAILLWGAEVPPEGWLELNGQAFDVTENPILASFYPDGQLPDYRGRFPRGWAHGSVVDPESSRTLGSMQEDAVQSMVETVAVPNRWRGVFLGMFQPGMSWSLTEGSEARGKLAKQSKTEGGIVTRFADETRPKNIAVMFIIKTDAEDDFQTLMAYHHAQMDAIKTDVEINTAFRLASQNKPVGVLDYREFTQAELQAITDDEGGTFEVGGVAFTLIQVGEDISIKVGFSADRWSGTYHSTTNLTTRVISGSWITRTKALTGREMSFFNVYPHYNPASGEYPRKISLFADTSGHLQIFVESYR